MIRQVDHDPHSQHDERDVLLVCLRMGAYSSYDIGTKQHVPNLILCNDLYKERASAQIQIAQHRQQLQMEARKGLETTFSMTIL